MRRDVSERAKSQSIARRSGVFNLKTEGALPVFKLVDKVKEIEEIKRKRMLEENKFKRRMTRDFLAEIMP